MKASALGVWHADAAELEEKVIGKKKVEAFLDGEERKRAVAKKKELAERLLAQYVHEFESSRGQSGDIKMLIATQRSGTATDKVSAFSVMVGENPVANLRSLDALLGKRFRTFYMVYSICCCYEFRNLISFADYGFVFSILWLYFVLKWMEVEEKGLRSFNGRIGLLCFIGFTFFLISFIGFT